MLFRSKGGDDQPNDEALDKKNLRRSGRRLRGVKNNKRQAGKKSEDGSSEDEAVDEKKGPSRNLQSEDESGDEKPRKRGRPSRSLKNQGQSGDESVDEKPRTDRKSTRLNSSHPV